MPFGIPQYIQCVLQGLTGVLLCVSFILLALNSINLVAAHDGFYFVMEIILSELSVFFIVATEVLFKQLLICIAV